MNRAQVDRSLARWAEQLLYAGLHSHGQTGKDARVRGGGVAPGGDLRARLRAIVRRAPEVTASVVGGGAGMGAIKTHLAYISRCGALELEDERGERSLGPEALAQLVQEWRLAGSKIPWRSQRREAVNIVLAMSQDGDVAALLGAAREFASTEFARHKFAMVLHEPQTDPRSHHPHVHLVVRAQGRDGVRLNPRKADLARWRQTFADRLLERGIVVAGTRRLTRGPIAGEAGLDEPRWAPPHEHATNAAARATRAEALRAWQGIAMALARSEDPQDRTLAILTMRYLQGMPITREVAMKNLGAGKSAEREEANGRQDRGRER